MATIPELALDAANGDPLLALDLVVTLIAARGELPEEEETVKQGDGLSRDPGAIYHWLRRNWRKTGKCGSCGSDGRTEWRNVSGELRHPTSDPSDWIELCRGCKSQAGAVASNWPKAA